MDPQKNHGNPKRIDHHTAGEERNQGTLRCKYSSGMTSFLKRQNQTFFLAITRVGKDEI
jgi:hypothetical protein